MPTSISNSARRAAAAAGILLFALAALTLAAQSVPLPTGVIRVATVEGVTEYRLANGFRFVLAPDPSLSTIATNMTYLVGSCHDREGEAGSAHLLEHFVAEGSLNHPNAKKEQQSRSARYTATTWVDRTSYYGALAPSEANLRWVLDLEADRMVNAVLQPGLLDTNRTVVRNEMQNRQTEPSRVLSQQVMASLYAGHGCRGATSNAASDLQNITLPQLQAFYEQYYRPDNAVLILVGRFDEAMAVRLIAQEFGVIPRPSQLLPSTPMKPPEKGERAVATHRTADLQFVAVAYRTPALAHDDSAAAELLASIVTSNQDGRLPAVLVTSGRAVQVTSSAHGMVDERALLFTAVVPREKSIDDARSAMLAALDAVASVPPGVDEVERARSERLAQFNFGITDAEGFSLALGEYAAAGDWRLFFLQRDRFSKASRDDVRRVAERYFRPASEIPRVHDISALVDSYRGGPNPVAGEAFEPSLENIEARTLRRTLPGGIKLALLPRRTRGATVALTLQLNYGDEKTLTGLATVAELTPAMLNRGTLRLSRQQLEDEAARLVLIEDPREGALVTGAGGMTRVTGQTVRQSLPGALHLIAQMLREPSFPAAEFESLRQERLMATERRRESPFDVALGNLARHLNPYRQSHPRYVSTVDERIARLKAVSLADVRRFHQEFFGASNMEIVLVGDFDAEEMVSLTRALFGDWRSRRRFSEVRRPYRQLEPINRTFHVHGQANAEIDGGIRLALSDHDDDYAAMVIANHIIGGVNRPGSRLYERIRTREGWSYSVGSRLRVFPEPHFMWRQSLAPFSTSARDNASDFLVFATATPENLEKVEAAIKEELQRALRDGFTPDEVAEAKRVWVQQPARWRDVDVAARLLERLHADRTMAYDMEMVRKVEALTPEQVLAALRRHLILDRMSFVKAGTFPKGDRPHGSGSGPSARCRHDR